MKILFFIVLFAVLILLTLFLGEFLKRKFNVKLEIARKTFHILAGITCIIGVNFFVNKEPLIFLCLSFIVFLYITLKLNLFKIQSEKRGYGTVFFAVGLLFLVLFFWDRKEIITISLLVLTFSDALAALFGEQFGEKGYQLANSKKTFIGSSVFFISSFILIFTSLFFYQANLSVEILLTTLICSFLITGVEAISTSSFDNFTIPLATSILLHITTNLNIEQGLWCLVGLLVMIAIVGITYKFKFVDISASIGVFVFGTIFFIIGSFKWWVPITVFFLNTSLLGLFSKKIFFNPYVEKEGKRDLIQIYSKGIISLFIVVFYHFMPYEIFYYLFLTVVAITNSDTWSSGLGGFSKQDSCLTLPFFKRVPKGVSGGISFIGFLAGILGSGLIASFIFIFDNNKESLAIFFLISTGGLIGNWLDSILGANLQGLYKCLICDKMSEKKIHCSSLAKDNKKIKGFDRITNDTVNFLSTLIGAIISLGILYLYIYK